MGGCHILVARCLMSSAYSSESCVMLALTFVKSVSFFDSSIHPILIVGNWYWSSRCMTMFLYLVCNSLIMAKAVSMFL